MQFLKSIFQFLQKLENNNNRDWFAEHKSDYEKSLLNAKGVFSEIYKNLKQHDEIEKQKFFRIYRDIEFLNRNKSSFSFTVFKSQMVLTSLKSTINLLIALVFFRLFLMKLNQSSVF